MNWLKNIQGLCTPSYLYLVLSAVGLLVSAFQNVGNSRRYHLGTMSCSVPSCWLVFALKVVYVLFWTWVLQLICKAGYPEISWLLILLPFILLFLVVMCASFYQSSASNKRR